MGNILRSWQQSTVTTQYTHVGDNKDFMFQLSEEEIENHDESIEAIFEAIRRLTTPPEKPRRKID